MKQKVTLSFTVLVMTIFFSSIIAILFTTGTQYPENMYQPPFASNDYDTSYWDLSEVKTNPLNINNISTIVVDNETNPLVEWRFNYESELYQGNVVTINSIILRQQNVSTPSPTILYLHGYGGQYMDYMGLFRDLASAGFVVMGIDHPGRGNSTGMPELTPYTFLNVTGGPQSSNLYHSVWAAARAISLLESMSFVNDSAIVVSGDSMGAWTSFIISAIDSRIDGVIPIIGAGSLIYSIMSGSLINSVIDPSYSLDSTEMQNIIAWFDPIAYARELTQPTLMLFGSDDYFFPIISMKDTIEAINAPLTLRIVPNWAHSVYEGFTANIENWIESQFLSGPNLSDINVVFNERMSVQGESVSINVNTTFSNRAWVCWRSGEPGAVWLLSEMMSTGQGSIQTYSTEIVPLTIGKVTFFVLVEMEDSIIISSSIMTASAGSVLFPGLFILSGLSLIALIRKGEWKPKTHHLVREVPYMIGMFMLGSGFVLPFIVIQGRTTLSVLEIIERFGTTFLLAGWFLPSFMAGLCFVLALSAYRHGFQFRVAGMLWTPVLAILIILFLILYGIFDFFGSEVLVELGWGGPIFLAGIILMQLLDKTVRSKLEKKLEELEEFLNIDIQAQD
ncbi:MAG: alpha/beta hydrolase family protein [Promethearchaeota archaeon]